MRLCPLGLTLEAIADELEHLMQGHEQDLPRVLQALPRLGGKGKTQRVLLRHQVQLCQEVERRAQQEGHGPHAPTTSLRKADVDGESPLGGLRTRPPVPPGQIVGVGNRRPEQEARRVSIRRL